MSQYQRILLLADPSLRRTPAFERAVWLARASGAALHIALFDRDPLISAAALVTDTRHTEARSRSGWNRGASGCMPRPMI